MENIYGFKKNYFQEFNKGKFKEILRVEDENLCENIKGETKGAYKEFGVFIFEKK